MKNNLVLSAIMAFTVLFQVSCTKKIPTDLTKTSFIPKPVSVVATGESFQLTSSTVVYYQEGVEGLQETAQYLAVELNRIGGITPTVNSTEEAPASGIYLSVGDQIGRAHV